MDDELENEILDILNTPESELVLETALGESESPLNRPVKEKDIAQTRAKEKTTATAQSSDYRSQAKAAQRKQRDDEPLDAPEQEIGVDDEGQTPLSDDTTTMADTIADEQSLLAATAVLGMADNLIAVGGGYFVKIKKHDAFYDFEEVIKIIDDQNQKNVSRIRLDEDDKALLTPLLARVLKDKVQQLSPEQQLLGAVISIIVKKAQIVMEVRSENKGLESRILDAIRTDKQEEPLPQTTPQPEASSTTSHRDVQKQPSQDPVASVSEEALQNQKPAMVAKDMAAETYIKEAIEEPIDETQYPNGEMAIIYEEADDTPVDITPPAPDPLE